MNKTKPQYLNWTVIQLLLGFGGDWWILTSYIVYWSRLDSHLPVINCEKHLPGSQLGALTSETQPPKIMEYHTVSENLLKLET